MATPDTKPTLIRKPEAAPTAPAVPAAQPPRPALPVRASDRDIGLREVRKGDWLVAVRQEHGREDVLRPEYLAHRMHRMEKRDRIFFEHPEWSLVAIVLRVDPDLRLVFLVQETFTDLKAATLASADMSELIVEEQLDGTWRIRRGHDVAASGLASEALAMRWIDDRRRGQIA